MTTGYVTFTFRIHREEAQYVARCVELGISSCGDSLDEALENIEEATTLYLNTLEEVGERDRVFSDAGIEILPGEPVERAVNVDTSTSNEVVAARNARLPQFTFC